MDKEFEYKKEALTVELAESIMRDFGVSPATALGILYNSDTYAKLCDIRTGLFFQSANYVYSFLKEELRTGKMVQSGGFNNQ